MPRATAAQRKLKEYGRLLLRHGSCRGCAGGAAQARTGRRRPRCCPRLCRCRCQALIDSRGGAEIIIPWPSMPEDINDIFWDLQLSTNPEATRFVEPVETIAPASAGVVAAVVAARQRQLEAWLLRPAALRSRHRHSARCA